MGWPAWKTFEAEVATFFGGKRHIRINRAESTGDIEEVPFYSLECKYGKQVPSYLGSIEPTILTVGLRRYRVIPSKYGTVGTDGVFDYNVLGWFQIAQPNATFLEKALPQADSYGTDGQIPMVCVKVPRRHGFNVIWEV